MESQGRRRSEVCVGGGQDCVERDKCVAARVHGKLSWLAGKMQEIGTLV